MGTPWTHHSVDGSPTGVPWEKHHGTPWDSRESPLGVPYGYMVLPWEFLNPVKLLPWESHGSTMGILWKCYNLMRVPYRGASMGLPWDLHGTCMGFPWHFRWTVLSMVIRDSHEDSSASMVPNGTPIVLPWDSHGGFHGAYIGHILKHSASMIVLGYFHGMAMVFHGTYIKAPPKYHVKHYVLFMVGYCDK